MNGFIFSSLTTIVPLGVIIYVSYRNLRALQKKGPWVPAVLFMFILTIWLSTGFYWTTHTLMMEEFLYDFSAMDIGENGLFLLMAALVGASFREPLPRDLSAFVTSFVFAMGNALLWGVWNGSWLRDIIAGLFLWLLVYTLIRGLKQTGSMNRSTWIFFGVGSAGILLLQIATALTKGTISAVFDFSSEVFWFLGILYFIFRIVRFLREDLPEKGAVILACAGCTWVLCTMYMSSEPYYTIADLINVFMLLLMMLVLERKWGESI